MQTRVGILLLFVTGCILLFISCTGDEQSIGGQLSLDSFETIQPELLFEFAESEEVVFESVRSMQVDDHSNILVLDSGQEYIFVFNRNGELIQRIGGEGRGPGKFVSLGSFLAENNRLWAAGWSLVKIEEFEYSDGEYIHSEAHLLDESSRVRFLLGNTEEGIIGTDAVVFYAGSRDHPTENSLSLIDLNDGSAEELLTYPVAEYLTTQENELIYPTKPMGRETLLAFNGQDRIYNLWTDSLAVHYFTLDGEQHPVFHHELTPAPITSAERDSILSDRQPRARNALRQQLADTKPMVNNLLVDDEQRIWVELNTEELGLGWFAFSSEGEPLLHMEIPDEDAELQDVRNGMMLWNFTDETGIPTIKAASIGR